MKRRKELGWEVDIRSFFKKPCITHRQRTLAA